MENNTLIEKMKQLGLNQYEAKAYLSLLKDFPVNGYILSKNSGVPRSRIYEVVDSLVKKQFVFENKLENSSMYYPLEPEKLVKKIKKNYQEVIDKVEIETRALYNNSSKGNESKSIIGRKNIFEFIGMLIEGANERIEVSIWEEELKDLKPYFDEALNNNVTVKGLYFGYNNPFKNVNTHRMLDTYLREKEERYIIIIIDNKEAVTGIVSREEESQVTWTNDYGVIDILKDYIVHDLMINVYSSMLSEEQKEEYERAIGQVRSDFFDK